MAARAPAARSQHVDPLHLGEHRQQCDGHVGAESRLAGVHGELVAERAQEDTSLGEVVHEVQGLAHVPAKPVQRQHVDPVPGTGEAKQSPQALAFHVGAGALVDVDVFLGDAGIPHRVDLPVEVLSGRAYTAVRKIHPATVLP
ncbi:hypothetical protein [Streptomyces sp. LBL]|uniref:hypothetical protein n=1 Tax=Streptomyces sp. LBL TaxID=2940562 RepID=UPI002476D962|nr:hypothetical protein [Streptomyces sp. LBL]